MTVNAPRAPASSSPWVVLLACGLSIVLGGFVLGHQRILSGSVDVAHHLQLAVALAGHWATPADGRLYMNEMFDYPDVAHRIAAMAMRAGLDPLSALTVVGAGAALAVWTGLLDTARRINPWAPMLAGALALVAALVGAGIHGQELVRNFFFAQIVAEALAWGVLLLASRSRPGVLRFAIAGAGTFLVASTHLLPTLKVAGALIVLIAWEVFRSGAPKVRVGQTLLAAAVTTALALIANPATRAMATISTNDGSADVGPWTPAHIVLLAAGLVAVCLLGFWRLWTRDRTPGRDERAATVLLAMGLATGAAALAQYLAWSLLGMSSAYAVLKHGFGVVTLLIVAAPAVAALWPVRTADLVHPGWLLLGPALAAAVTTAVLLRPSLLPVRAIAPLLRAVADIRDANQLPPGGRAYFAGSGTSPLVSYMASVAILRAPRDGNAIAILETGRPSDLHQAQWIVSRTSDVTYAAPACRRGRAVAELSVSDAPCLTGERGQPGLRFSAGGSGLPYLGDGWAQPDVGGVWSAARRMTVTLPAPAALRTAAQGRVELVLFAFLTPGSPTRHMTARIGDGPSVSHAFDLRQVNEHTLRLEIPASLRRGTSLPIHIVVSDPVSPQSLGLGPDPRPLGVGLKEARVVLSR